MKTKKYIIGLIIALLCVCVGSFIYAYNTTTGYTGSQVDTFLQEIDDLDGVSGIIKCDGAGDFSAATVGTDYYAPGSTDVSLADGGTGASLSDPNADRGLFWDDSAGTITWLAFGNEFTFSGTTLDLSTIDISSGEVGDGTYSWDHTPMFGIEGTLEVDGTLYADGGIQSGASATPGITGDDSDTTSSPDWKIYGNATDTTEGSEDVDLFLQEKVDGSMTTIMHLDADGNVEVAHDINLASGKKYKINGSQISSDDLSDATTINTNLLEFINKDLTTLHSGEDKWVYIPTTCSWTSVHVGYDGTVTDLVFTVYSADSPYGTTTTIGTIDPDNSPSVSGWSNITAGKWVKMEVTTASTGDATACQVAFVLTNQ